MRCFIAVELDNETRTILTNVQKNLVNLGVKGNFTRPENLHLTLKFLGEIDQSTYLKVCRLLSKVAQRHQTFVTTFNEVGKFNKRNKKILWAGFSKNKNLIDLYTDIEDELKTIMPIETEKYYTPHITLIREAVLAHKINNVDISELLKHTFKVSGISLMESTRVDGKLTYVQRAYECFYK